MNLSSILDKVAPNADPLPVKPVAASRELRLSKALTPRETQCMAGIASAAGADPLGHRKWAYQGRRLRGIKRTGEAMRILEGIAFVLCCGYWLFVFYKGTKMNPNLHKSNEDLLVDAFAAALKIETSVASMKKDTIELKELHALRLLATQVSGALVELEARCKKNIKE